MKADNEVRDRYASGGLLGNLTPGRNIGVLVVDLQYGFTETRYAPGFDLHEVVAGTRTLVDAAREHGVPVWFTTIAFPTAADGRGATWLAKMPALTGLREGHRSTLIDDRLGMRPDEGLVVKQTASAFAHTDLAKQLHGSGIDTIVVAGATTSGCIRATIVDACAADIPAFVVRECVGDREEAPHDASLFDIEAKYGDVVSLNEALDLVRGKP
ncbi:isochorismatase family protein [Rhodococcus artemisiae]|uniref:Isochorismatase family protein n=1 Tax=Rhodococcus artemisiae TaxID=714159 RepID=A0ABU7LFR8_9NOCA|nr:isochorismatase family protein [Rhodococcus artemisiae]MEE2060355.1 isochorismatase family protein [Rhodococcus artemisiae]